MRLSLKYNFFIILLMVSWPVLGQEEEEDFRPYFDIMIASGYYTFLDTDIFSDDNKAERIKVDLGDSSGNLIAIDGLLTEGDRVAVRGAENLREGAEVKIMLSQHDTPPGNHEG